MKGSKGPGRHRCEATLLQMNDAKVDLEYKEVVRKGDKQEGVFWSLHSDLMIQIKDQFRLSTVNNKLCKKCVKNYSLPLSRFNSKVGLWSSCSSPPKRLNYQGQFISFSTPEVTFS